MVIPYRWIVALFRFSRFVRADELTSIPVLPNVHLIPSLSTNESSISNSFERQDASSLFSPRAMECIPASYLPCVNDPLHCCPVGNNCYPTLDMCCPTDAVPCGIRECYQKGATCCQGGGGCLASAGNTCCRTEAGKSGCCKPGLECCPQGETCCSKAEGQTCCPGGCCPKDTKCHPTLRGKCVPNMPVMEFPYTPLVLDETLRNMCLGMGGANERVLTWSNTRNDGGKCRGCCSGVTVAMGITAGDPTSCDEFPFATSLEALNPGARLACVDAYENSFQGWWIRTNRRALGIKSGQQYIVRVTGMSCASVNPSTLIGCGGVVGGTVKREVIVRDGRTTVTGTESRSFPSITNTSNIVVVPLGDLQLGDYTIAAHFPGQIEYTELLDSGGDLVADSPVSAANLAAGQSFSFSLVEEVFGAFLMVSTQDEKPAGLTWTMTAPSTSSTAISTLAESTSTAPAPRPTQTPAQGSTLEPGHAVLAAFICILAAL